MTELEPTGTTATVGRKACTDPPPPIASRQVQWTLLVLAAGLMVGQLVWYQWAVVSPQSEVTDRGGPYRFEVDLNFAEPKEIALLPGVGKVLAERIARHRRAVGGFQSWNDVRGVSGVGPKKIEAMRPLCRPFDSESSEDAAAEGPPRQVK